MSEAMSEAMSEVMSDTSQGARHPIGVVAERTGLSQELLRVWERRYDAVVPTRTRGGQRLYTDDDVSRLRLLRQATQGGRAIGTVARLPLDELERLIHDDAFERDRPAAAAVPPPAPPVDLDLALGHARALDGQALESLLGRAATVHGASSFLERVVAPLMRRVGDEWHAGRLSPEHEHLVTAVVQRLVLRVLWALGADDDAPSFLVAAPSGEPHEIGALLAAAAAAAEGWRVIYLGANVPAADIAAAAVATGAHAVGVSIVLADSPARVAAELRTLSERLPDSVPLVVGGGGARAAVPPDAAPRALLLADLDALRATLRRLRLASIA